MIGVFRVITQIVFAPRNRVMCVRNTFKVHMYTNSANSSVKSGRKKLIVMFHRQENSSKRSTE